MRNITPQLLAHLGGNATTICRCWKLIRLDGHVLGFTEHDRELNIQGQAYQPMSGLDATVAQASTGLNPGSVEVLGALTSQDLSSQDIRANRYDGARVEVLVVNWNDPSEFLLENVYHVGEITEEDGLFKAELRTIESELDQTRGEHFIRQCQTRLGDNRCMVDLDDPAFKGQGNIIAYDGNLQVTVSGLDTYEKTWFENGLLTWTSGENTAVSMEITSHVKEQNETRLQLWKSLLGQISVGDSFEIIAGCDKNFSTCKEKFANAINFRGFPHLPGNEFALSYASNSEKFGGGIIVQ